MQASRSAPAYLEPFLQKTITSPRRGIGRGDTSRKKWVSKVPPIDSRIERRRRLLAWPPFHAKPTAEPAWPTPCFLPGTLHRLRVLRTRPPVPGVADEISDMQLSPATPRQHESGAAFESQTGAKQVPPTRELPGPARRACRATTPGTGLALAAFGRRTAMQSKVAGFGRSFRMETHPILPFRTFCV